MEKERFFFEINATRKLFCNAQRYSSYTANDEFNKKIFNTDKHMEERWIKRYANRKMYDVESSRYVSLGDLAEIIRLGESIKVTDKNGQVDYTAQVLRQIIMEQSKQSDASSVSMLHEWVRVGGAFLDRQWDDFRSGMEDWIRDQKNRLLKGLNREDFETLRMKVEELEKKVEEWEKRNK